MTINTRIHLIKLWAAALLIGPGFLMITAPVTGLTSWVNLFLDFAFQPFDGAQAIEGGAASLLNAILGGILIGFGAMIWMVSEHVFRADQALGRKLILTPLLAWFFTDSAGSILTGAWFNAVMNAVFLALFLIPLLAGRRGV